jgi:ABC-type Fe3+-hydroxamate transport system substrate-binding protein
VGYPAAVAIRIRDDRNRELLFFHPPRRVVSLVPSDTLTLFALGAGDRLVGRTSYCVEPAGQVEEIAACGGTKDTDVEAVLALAPDLVLANQEENSRRPLEELARRGAPVLVAFPRRVADGFAHVARLARILGVEREPAARALIRAGYEALRAAEAAAVAEPVEVFVPIWMDPLMTFSDGTFASDLLAACGARNVFGDRARRYPLAADLGRAPALGPERVGERDTRYPRVTLDEVVARDPAVVLLPDEPHEFGEADAEVFRRALPKRAVRFVDGKDLFWHGARTVEALGRLRALLADSAP